MRIKLNRDEVDYLLSKVFLPSIIRSRILSAHSKPTDYILEVSEDEADELRDLCGEQLQVEGFDQDYKLTKAGHVLESLIDKFFVS